MKKISLSLQQFEAVVQLLINSYIHAIQSTLQNLENQKKDSVDGFWEDAARGEFSKAEKANEAYKSMKGENIWTAIHGDSYSLKHCRKLFKDLKNETITTSEAS